MRPIPVQPLALGRPSIARPRSLAHGLLEILRQLAACASLDAAADEVHVPEALATPLSARSRRHLRTARVSWW